MSDRFFEHPWLSWFAWYPVRIERKTVWLRWIERRHCIAITGRSWKEYRA